MTDPKVREREMVETYGEVCSRAKAARILHRGPYAINTMLEDGRLDYACQGEMVDVRSIARYIDSPKVADEAARIRRLQRKNKSRWAV